MTVDFNQQVIEEFRANHGRVGDFLEDARLILLTTTGARTGAPHTVPLGFLPDVDRIFVIGSAGAAGHPAWFHNLVADPAVTVEDGLFSYQAEATVLTGAERDEIFARAVESDPGWADEAGSSRTLPVVGLREVGGRRPLLPSFGEGLRIIHDAIRRELALIRKEFTSAGPALGERFPGYGPVIERLRAEHVTIAGLIEELREAVSTGDGGAAEVERVIDGLEAHFAYEEEQLIPLLDVP